MPLLPTLRWCKNSIHSFYHVRKEPSSSHFPIFQSFPVKNFNSYKYFMGLNIEKENDEKSLIIGSWHQADVDTSFVYSCIDCNAFVMLHKIDTIKI